MDIFGSWCIICEQQTHKGIFCSVKCLQEEYSRSGAIPSRHSGRLVYPSCSQ